MGSKFILYLHADGCHCFCAPHSYTIIQMLNIAWFRKSSNLLTHPSNGWHGTYITQFFTAWWRHQMDTFSAILALFAGNSQVTGEFSTQRPVTRSFDAFFDLRLNKCWVNNREAGDLRPHRAHYGVIVMQIWVTFLCHQAIVIYHFIFSLCNEGPFNHSQSVPTRACTPGPLFTKR